ncbi:MAG TPA: hypothetical protein D7I02_06470, partial [Candidatus Poseidoniales archaeon]
CLLDIFLFERRPKIINGAPKIDGINAVKLPVSLIRYEAIPDITRRPPHMIAKFGTEVPINLNSSLIVGRMRQTLRLYS